MGVKKNSRIITKIFADKPEKGFPIKWSLQPFGITSPFRQRGCKEIFENETCKFFGYFALERNIDSNDEA